MLSTLVLYLSAAALGALSGAKGLFPDRARRFMSTLQLFSIVVLIFTIGARIGSDEMIIRTLPSMGLSAFVITFMTILGSILFMSIGRRMLGFDRYGYRHRHRASYVSKADATDQINTHTAVGSANMDEKKDEPDLTKIILITVVIGMVSGYLFIPDLFIEISGSIMTVGLCVLLFTAGIDIGCQKGIIDDIKRNGFAIVLFPLLVYAGTCTGAVAASLLLKYTLLETTTVAVGMGWATLAPILIAEKSAELSAVSFLANIMREFLAITFIPLIAKKMGYIEALAPAGCTAMDTSLPVIERSTNSSVVICSFISGVIHSCSVPLITPVLVAML